MYIYISKMKEGSWDSRSPVSGTQNTKDNLKGFTGLTGV